MLPQMCSRTLAAHRVQAVDQLPLEGQDELLVDLRADQRGGGVAHADQVRAASTWARANPSSIATTKPNRSRTNARIVEEIGHQAVDAPQVGGLGAGAFDPALDQFLAADALAQQRGRLDAVVHPPAAERIGDLQPREHALVGQQGMGFVHRRRLIVEVLDGGAAIGGLAGGIGDAGDVVEVELLGRADLRLDHHPMIGGVPAIGNADLVGRRTSW